MTPEGRARKIIDDAYRYPQKLTKLEDTIANAIRTAQAEQRRKDGGLMCQWCREAVPTLTLTEGSQGHSKGVLVHLEQERILGACPAQTILAQEE